jgi:hypothetical protein
LYKAAAGSAAEEDRSMRVIPILAVLFAAAVTGACGSNSNSASAPTPVPTAATGIVQVKIIGAGSMGTSGYTVTVDGASTQTIQNDAMMTFTNVSAGVHAVTLSGFAANCRAVGDNPRSVTVPPGGTVTVEFELVCSVSSPTDPA